MHQVRFLALAVVAAALVCAAAEPEDSWQIKTVDTAELVGRTVPVGFMVPLGRALSPVLKHVNEGGLERDIAAVKTYTGMDEEGDVVPETDFVEEWAEDDATPAKASEELALVQLPSEDYSELMKVSEEDLERKINDAVDTALHNVRHPEDVALTETAAKPAPKKATAAAAKKAAPAKATPKKTAAVKKAAAKKAAPKAAAKKVSAKDAAAKNSVKAAEAKVNAVKAKVAKVKKAIKKEDAVSKAAKKAAIKKGPKDSTTKMLRGKATALKAALKIKKMAKAKGPLKPNLHPVVHLKKNYKGKLHLPQHFHVPTKKQVAKKIYDATPPAIHTSKEYWKLKQLKTEYRYKKGYEAMREKMLRRELQRHYASKLERDHMRRKINTLRRKRALDEYGPGARYKPFTWGEYDEPSNDRKTVQRVSNAAKVSKKQKLLKGLKQDAKQGK